MLEPRLVLSGGPVLVNNTTVSVPLGGSTTITPTELLANGGTSTPATVVFTLTAVPQIGSLDLSGNPLVVGGTFSEQDIGNGLVTYVQNPADSSAPSDSFGYTIANGGTSSSNYLASVSLSGGESNGQSYNPSISADGRYVGFASFASNLVANDTNTATDGFIYDTTAQTTTRVTTDSINSQLPLGGGNVNEQNSVVVSGNGQDVVFSTLSSGLLPSGTINEANVFEKNLATRKVSLVSAVNGTTTVGNNFADIAESGMSTSTDGRYVVFTSIATNLVSTPVSGNKPEVYLRDMQTNTTTLVSETSAGVAANDQSDENAISPDGRYIAFRSDASNLAPGTPAGVYEIYVHDMVTGTTTLVSTDSSGNASNADSSNPSITLNGELIAFDSAANNLVSGDTNKATDVFVHNTATGQTVRVSVDSSGNQDSQSLGSGQPSITPDGRYVAFASHDHGLSSVSGFYGGIFVHDMTTGQTTLISVTSAGLTGNGIEYYDPVISADGQTVAYSELSATNLVSNSTGAFPDIIVARQTPITISGTTNITIDHPPTITAIANQFVATSTPTAAVAFTVGDSQTAASQLKLSAATSNSFVVPLSNIVFGGNGANRTVTVSPALGQVGFSQITVTVTDGVGLSTSTTFTVSVNTPILSPIVNQSTQEATVTSAIPFTASGDQITPVDQLTYAATSSNTTLVPNANIVLGGTGANRTVTVTPAAFQTGNTAIIITAADGNGTTAVSVFLLTVVPGPPPTITPVSDQSITSGQTLPPLAFTINDLLTPVAQLTLSGTSSNQALISNGGIVFGGSGANRTVTLSPTPGQIGTSKITLTVTDLDGRKSSTSFSFSVLTASDVPTITPIPNQTIPENSLTGGLSFQIADPDNPLAPLTVSASSSNQTLVPNANLTIAAGAGGYRQLSVAATNGQTGNATITVNVSNGVHTASTTFVLTVTPQGPPGPGPAPTAPIPSISSVANQITLVNTPVGPLAFSVADPLDPTATLSVLASSSNPGLVATGGLLLGGSASNPTLTVVPVANRTGTATITMQVASSSGTSSTTSFQLTVQPAGLAAPLPPPATSTFAGQVNASLTFVAPAITLTNPVGPLTYSAMNLPSGAAFNPATNQFSWTPAANQGPATYTVVFTATDGVHSSSELVTLDVFNPTPMYVAFNPVANVHVFTTSAWEFQQIVQNGLQDQSSGQTGFAVDQGSGAGAVPLHRLYDPNNGLHYYTTSDGERDSLVKQGWNFEADEGYVYTTQVPGTSPIFRLYNTQNGDHFYTASATQEASILSQSPGVWQVTTNLGFGFATTAQGAISLPSTPAPELSSSSITAAAISAAELSVGPGVAATSVNAGATLAGVPVGGIGPSGTNSASGAPTPPAASEPSATSATAGAPQPARSPAALDTWWSAVAGQIAAGLDGFSA